MNLPYVIQVSHGAKTKNILNTNINLIKEDIWSIQPNSNRISINFLKEKDSFTILLNSKPVSSNSLSESSYSGKLLLYFGVLLIIGFIIRILVIRISDSLWIDKMREPQMLYRTVIAIEAFRMANEVDKEYILTKKLLDTLSSQEKCIEITSNK